MKSLPFADSLHGDVLIFLTGCKFPQGKDLLPFGNPGLRGEICQLNEILTQTKLKKRGRQSGFPALEMLGRKYLFQWAGTFSNVTKCKTAQPSAGPSHAGGLMLELKATLCTTGQSCCGGVFGMIIRHLYPGFQSQSSNGCLHAYTLVLGNHPDVLRAEIGWVGFFCLEM